MSCKTNGATYLNSCIPAPGATSTAATYSVELTHFLCGNRKICINGGFPLTSDLSFQVLGTPRSVGNSIYACDILCRGTVTYMPYVKDSCEKCNVCPRTENVWVVITIPISSATAPTITAGTVVVQPANVKDCCSICNAVSLSTSFAVAS